MSNNVIFETYLLIFVLAVMFYLLSKIQTNYLIVIIIICMVGVIVFVYLQNLSKERTNSLVNIETALDNDIKDRTETNEKIFYLDKFPKNVKYLKQSHELVDIITNLRFTLKFNKTRYTDVILNMNKLMKIYIYILSDRYDVIQYISLFTDIRENIIELMYSFFMIIPANLKHTYALDPHTEIYRSINDFMIHSRSMLQTLEKFALIHNKNLYIPDSAYKPYDANFAYFP